jgi:hypothetical protein
MAHSFGTETLCVLRPELLFETVPQKESLFVPN